MGEEKNLKRIWANAESDRVEYETRRFKSSGVTEKKLQLASRIFNKKLNFRVGKRTTHE
jgi:hypothetical protein